jgi:multisubunit Na+/H+ antiporter MnhG subunit
MRPRLHRAAKIRLISRLAAFVAVALAFVIGGDLLGAHSALAQGALAASAFALLVLPVALPMLKPARARTTLPRTLASPTA